MSSRQNLTDAQFETTVIRVSGALLAAVKMASPLIDDTSAQRIVGRLIGPLIADIVLMDADGRLVGEANYG